MRLLFSALGAYGHLYPLMPLAVAAREAGHHVVFATPEDFHPALAKAGLEPAAAGVLIGEAFATLFPGDPATAREAPPEDLDEIIGQVFGRMLPDRFSADLRALFSRSRPDLVVYEFSNVGAAFAAMAAGVPALGHGFGRVSREGPMIEIERVQREHAAELGFTDDRPSWGNPVVDICPPSVQAPDFLARARRVPLRPVGWSDTSELPPGLPGRDRTRPLIYLTLGTSPMSHADLLTAAITGLSGLDAQVLVATGPSLEVAALGQVPPNVRLESWVPQSALLPHVDLVVHHGGSGTTLGAFGAGVPQLVLPQGADQFTNAAAVLAAGVGSRLVGDEATAESVRSSAAALLADPTVADAARGLAAEVAGMPSPAEVAARLGEYA
ncbi:glycosyltransferase [Amycolatopsis sp. PS_44_ISF1]|uniref:glycosyltransferase n=1 Tax=Amycolatopsis sp. PS_44_ISF1 TaxID=2974917 RepID=UPI0028DFE5FF|nr:glycosyltransferase [Amycolatopsis sp. PS_44_ISF1]MDT8909539.1 glycosyltransferase [Amycolatopsis sp. PS_44_ISF1]